MVITEFQWCFHSRYYCLNKNLSTVDQILDVPIIEAQVFLDRLSFLEIDALLCSVLKTDSVFMQVFCWHVRRRHEEGVIQNIFVPGRQQAQFLATCYRLLKVTNFYFTLVFVNEIFNIASYIHRIIQFKKNNSCTCATQHFLQDWQIPWPLNIYKTLWWWWYLSCSDDPSNLVMTCHKIKTREIMHKRMVLDSCMIVMHARVKTELMPKCRM